MLEKLLERIDQKEFETLAEDIKRSLSEHRKWMHKITLAIVAKQPMEEIDFIAKDAHHHCKFGCWMKEVLKDEIFQNGSFLRIDELHKQLHSSARLLMLQLKNDGEVNLFDFEEFLSIQREFFDMVLMIFEFSVVNKHQFDITTNLMNRRTVGTVLANEQHRMQRAEDSSCCIAIADIDNFKNFNDAYGHDAGDLVLEQAASVFNSSIRRYDTVARFGGEEFLFVLPDMTLEEATQAIERVRIILAEHRVAYGGISLGVTASFGVTQLCHECDIRDSIKRADIALYQAKDSGRNCTVVIDTINVREELGLIKVAEVDQQVTLQIQKHCQKIT